MQTPSSLECRSCLRAIYRPRGDGRPRPLSQRLTGLAVRVVWLLLVFGALLYLRSLAASLQSREVLTSALVGQWESVEEGRLGMEFRADGAFLLSRNGLPLYSGTCRVREKGEVEVTDLMAWFPRFRREDRPDTMPLHVLRFKAVADPDGLRVTEPTILLGPPPPPRDEPWIRLRRKDR